MDMRKVFLIFALFLAIYAFKEISEFEKQVAGNFGYMLQNLPQEKVYLHTDKSTYTVGENVWFRAYQVHAAVNVPMVHSRFIYVDLVDKRDSLVRRVKVMERDSSFYGQLALLAGSPRASRIVGAAMFRAPAGLPCHRVLYRDGTLCCDEAFGGKEIQRQLLEAEGVAFLPDGRVDLKLCLWPGPEDQD